MEKRLAVVGLAISLALLLMTGIGSAYNDYCLHNLILRRNTWTTSYPPYPL